MKSLLRLFFLLFCFSSSAQDSGYYPVYLVGDAGEDTIPGKALLMLKDELLKNPNSTVIFLGDNVYPSGLQTNNKNSVLHLESQLQILQQYKGQAYFIPGNHDWDSQKRSGLQTLKNEELYVETYLKTKTAVANKEMESFLPKSGLPGPETLLLRRGLRIVIIDTQWFLHYYDKGTIGSKANTKELFYKRLDSILTVAKNNKEQVLVVAHHPVYSNGQHAKAKQPFRFLVNCTPFQIFGLFGINRLYSQDMAQPRYKKMRNHLLSIFSKYDNITYACGHDHNLQCFKENKIRYIVSGSGSKRSHLLRRKKFNSVFQDDQKTGFIKLDYSFDSYQSTTIYRAGEAELKLDGY